MRSRTQSEKRMRAWISASQRLHLAMAGELAVDLGTANTRVYAVGRGVVLNEPSVIAFNKSQGRVVAVGRQAKMMIGREPSSIRVVCPLRDGVIADFDAAEKMLSHFIRRARTKRAILGPRVLLCVPSKISHVAHRAVEDAAYLAGASQVSFVAEPFAAAVGVGLDVWAAHAAMIVNVGGGTVNIAVLSLGGLIHTSTLRVGGTEIDEAIAQYLHQERGLAVGKQTAEAIKHWLGSADCEADGCMFEVGGQSLTTRLPSRVEVSSAEVQAAIEPLVQKIMRSVRESLEELPPEVAADLIESGMVLTGGGAQLLGLTERLGRESGLEVRLVANPECAVVVGAGLLLRPDVPVPELLPEAKLPAPDVLAPDLGFAEAPNNSSSSGLLAAPHA